MKLHFHLSRHPMRSKIVNIEEEKLSLDRLIEIAVVTLEIAEPGRDIKIYAQSGEEIKDIDIISKGDHLYILHCSDLSCFECQELYFIDIVGKDGIGKSALTLQYIQGQFVPDYDRTIEDVYRKHIGVDGKLMLIDITDTVAYQDDFVAIRSTWRREKDGYILLFDITDRESFEYLHSYYDQLAEVYEGCMKLIYLVGNKVDLTSITNVRNIQQIHFIITNWFTIGMNINLVLPLDVSNIIVNYCPLTQREVTYEEACKLANEWNAVGYIETSAKTGLNVTNMFGDFIRNIIAKEWDAAERDLKVRKSRRCCII